MKIKPEANGKPPRERIIRAIASSTAIETGQSVASIEQRLKAMNARDSEKPDLLDFLHVHRDRINALGVQYGARRIRVFGSVARREEGPESDVDFLVDFPRGYDMLTQRLALVGELERLLARNVEVIPEHELNRHLKERVIGEAIEL